MSKWIDVEKELPPCDGFYEVTNNPASIYAEGSCNYDGIGFFYVHAYRPIRFWRPPMPTTKKYGKVDVRVPHEG